MELRAEHQFGIAETDGGHVFLLPNRLHAKLFPVEVEALLDTRHFYYYRMDFLEHRNVVVPGVYGYEFTGFNVSECYIGMLSVVISDVGIFRMAYVSSGLRIHIDLPTDVM